MNRIRNSLILLIVLVLSLACQLWAGAKNPIESELFDTFLNCQHKDFQNELAKIVRESEGYLVSGPIDIRVTGTEFAQRVFHSVRIVCPDIQSLEMAIARIDSATGTNLLSREIYLTEAKTNGSSGFRGALATIEWNDDTLDVQMTTTQQTRWLIWAIQFYTAPVPKINQKSLDRYAVAVSDYLYRLDSGDSASTLPVAAEYGLARQYDIFATPPDYVIRGYQNYLDFLYAHAAINTDFARGVKAFVPTDSLFSACPVHGFVWRV